MQLLFDLGPKFKLSSGRKYLSVRFKVEFDCKEGQKRMLSLSQFSGNMGSGSPQFSFVNPSEWESVENNNLGGKAWEIACNGARKKATWSYVGENQQTTFYAEPATILKTDGMVITQMWGLTDSKVVEGFSPFTYLSMISLSEYDCKEEKHRTLYLSSHSENMAEGETVIVNNKPDDTWSSVLPGRSANRKFWKLACGK